MKRLHQAAIAAAWLIWPTFSEAAAKTVAKSVTTQPAPCITQSVSTATDIQPAAFRDCVETPVMVTIPPGNFRMGNTLGTGTAYEYPVHEVRIRSFAIGRFEVTRAEWAACERASACLPPGEADAAAQSPVAGVSWDQTRQYLTWVSTRTGHRYRLPSEAEWEYAGRAGTINQYTWGDAADLHCQQANAFDRSGHQANPLWNWQSECDDGFAKAAPVGRFPPNPWGLHDMLGNVWEWVGDCWHSDYTGAPADGSTWAEEGCTKRVNRGGGWGNNTSTLRLTGRDADPASARSDGLGFRVARDLAP